MKRLYKLFFLSLLILVGFISFSPVSYAFFSLESNFGNSGKVTTSFGNDAYTFSVVSQPDGKLVTVGYASDGNHYNWAIVRYNTDGSLDTSFGNSGTIIRDFGFNNFAKEVVLQPDGKIVVGGSGGSYGGWTVERYNNNGSLDTTFGVNGTVETPILTSPDVSTDGGAFDALMLQSDGKIVTAGYIPQNNDQAVVVRYNPDGRLDQTFGVGGIAQPTFGGYGRVHAGALQSDGKIVVFGDRTPSGSVPSLMRFNQDGSLDQTFGPISDNFASQAGAVGMTIQPDGKIIIVGQFIANGIGHAYAIRYNPDGSRDIGFGNNGLYSSINDNDRANAVIVQSDGKVIIGGGDGNNFKLTRLNSNGTADLSFGSNGSIITQMGSGYNDIHRLIFHGNGKILAVGGVCNSYCDWALAQYQDDSASLDVPLLKQTSEPWQSNIYDSANIWSPTNSTINAWGCAMTSATMVLKYHGINKLPDNTSLDPGSLNTWLNSQKDGYVKTGWVNWLALSRLSKLAKQSGNNPDFTYDALEYQRRGGDKTKLTEDLNNGIPGILEVPGHFVVAKGISGDTFSINDPFFNRTILNDGYNNTFIALGRYIPSNTDLSYFMFSVEPEVSVAIFDSNGSVDNIEEFIQNPIINPQNNTQNNGSPTKIIYVQKPNSDTYTVSLSSNSPIIYHFDSYLYDQNGEVVTKNQLGSLNNSKNDEFRLVFNKSDANSSSNIRIITFQSTIDDVNEQKVLKLIHDQFAKLLISSLNSAQKDYDAGRTNGMKKKLLLIKTGLIYAPSFFIKKDAKTILLEDVNTLIQNSTPSS